MFGLRKYIEGFVAERVRKETIRLKLLDYMEDGKKDNYDDPAEARRFIEGKLARFSRRYGIELSYELRIKPVYGFGSHIGDVGICTYKVKENGRWVDINEW